MTELLVAVVSGFEPVAVTVLSIFLTKKTIINRL